MGKVLCTEEKKKDYEIYKKINVKLATTHLFQDIDLPYLDKWP